MSDDHNAPAARGLASKLRDAEAEVERLKRAIGYATCQEVGEHDWKHIGGCNAGCNKYCNCSIPVHECTRCGDCDYGDNDDARDVRRQCADGNPEWCL